MSVKITNRGSLDGFQPLRNILRKAITLKLVWIARGPSGKSIESLGPQLRHVKYDTKL